MPIKWSALGVSNGLDEMDRLLNEAEPILKECCQKANETAKLPKLAGYISEPLMNLAYEMADRLERYHQRIERIRGYIPERDLSKDRKQFHRWLELFGDEQKAKEAMATFK